MSNLAQAVQRHRFAGRLPRRITAFTLILAAVCLSLNTGNQAISSEPGRGPNIVLIMADDLGYAELGSYGQTKIKTPNLDRLATQGMRFTQFYSGSAVCAPARCSLMTGRHGGHAVIRSNSEVGGWDSFRGQLPLPAEEVTMAETLKAAGYVCGAFGKWGLGEVGSPGDPLKQGFDRFFGYNCQRHAHNYYPRYLVDDDGQRKLPGNDRGQTGKQYAPQLIADELLKFVREHQAEPFFVYYPTVIPHLALQVPDEELEPYRHWEETPYTGKSYLPHPTPKAAYAGMITFLDKQVGRLLALLDELKLADNTIVIFTSDNGTTMLKPQVDYEFFESVGPLRGLKGELYEGGIRVPLIVRWPGHVKPGTTSDLPAANYDLLATVAAATGTQPPAGIDSVSILPTLIGKPDQQTRHEYLFWDFTGYGGQVAARLGNYKGIKRNLRKNPDVPLELYDLAADPGEQHNIAAEQPEIAAKLEKILLEGRTRPDYERFQFGKYGDD